MSEAKLQYQSSKGEKNFVQKHKRTS